MKNFRLSVPSFCARTALTSLIALGCLATIFAQSPGPDLPGSIGTVGTTETIPAGSIVIPMDDKQNITVGSGGNAHAIFNLKVYGLIQALLEHNIPVKWAIKPGKASGANDFSVAAALLDASGNPGSSASTDFAGGPFIIAPGYEFIAREVIYGGPDLVGEVGFKSQTPGDRNSSPSYIPNDTAASLIKIYVTTASVSVPVRYTVVHKPQVAIGHGSSDGLTLNVHESLFKYAMIDNWDSISNADLTADGCYTMITQPHYTYDASDLSKFNAFLSSGGNLLLQCLSITSFENQTNGHFQTTNGWHGQTSTSAPSRYNGTPLRANNDMPFAQFIGSIPSEQAGLVADFDFDGLLSGGNQSGPKNNLFTIAYNKCTGSGPASQGETCTTSGNPGNHPTSYVATEAVVGTQSATKTTYGGAVFELGGHDYFQSALSGSGSNTTFTIANVSADQVNAQRLILNSLFVPVTRPASCNASIPTMAAYKTAQLTTDANGNGLLNQNDHLTWTIIYVNTSQFVDYPNFAITDDINSITPGVMTYDANSLNVVASNGATATADSTFDGTSSHSNILQSGASLPRGGRIVVTFTTKVTISSGVIKNQAWATGTNIAVQPFPTDALDNNTAAQLGVQTLAGSPVVPQSGLIAQTLQTTASNDPTRAVVASPTAAPVSISGRVITATGDAILRAKVTVTLPTGAIKTAYTNTTGQFTVSGLDANQLYTITVTHPSYLFTQADGAPKTLMINDDVVGLVFTANAPPSRR